MPEPLPDLRALAAAPFAPQATRTLSLFGGGVELAWLPQRSRRPGFPTPERPPFRGDPVDRILAEETQWRGSGIALTANRFPFARQQVIAWSVAPIREHAAELLTTALQLAERSTGTALINTIGAAASIPRAHAHVTTETQPFLAALPERSLRGDFLPAVAGVEYVAKAVPFCLLGIRGAVPARAVALGQLQVCRMTAACNIVDCDGTTWVYPRSAVETPSPWFPYALGAAEVWGRWCFVDEATFAAATADDLARALEVAGCRPLAG